MNHQINDWACDQHENRFDCPDALLSYNERFDEYGIIVHDGGISMSVIHFCPYCGTELPASKRDLWFDTLEKLGFDDPWEQQIPKAFETDAWYTKEG